MLLGLSYIFQQLHWRKYEKLCALKFINWLFFVHESVTISITEKSQTSNVPFINYGMKVCLLVTFVNPCPLFFYCQQNNGQNG